MIFKNMKRRLEREIQLKEFWVERSDYISQLHDELVAEINLLNKEYRKLQGNHAILLFCLINLCCFVVAKILVYYF